MIVFCSDKGSPGTTSTAYAVAAGWPVPAIVFGADPFGDDLPLRIESKNGVLADRETTLTVAAAANASRDAKGQPLPASGDLIERYAQAVNDQVSVVPGPVLAELAGSVPEWRMLSAALELSTRSVMVDLGRVHSNSPILAVAARASVIVPVCRGEYTSVIRLRDRLDRLVPVLSRMTGQPPRIFPVVVTPARFSGGDGLDVQRALQGTKVGPFVVNVGTIAYDTAAMERLYAGEDPHGRLAKTALMKSARNLAAQLAVFEGVHDVHGVAVGQQAPDGEAVERPTTVAETLAAYNSQSGPARRGGSFTGPAGGPVNGQEQAHG